MKLNRTGAMQSAFSLKIGSMGEFWRNKVTNKNNAPININCSSVRLLHNVLAFPFVNSKNACSAIASCGSLVLHISPVGNLTKIFNPVIGTLAINVVKKTIREHAVDVQPCQPMGLVRDGINVDVDVPVVIQVTSRTASQCHAATDAPIENTSVLVVMKQLFESFLREGRIIGSHAVVPFKQWFGQRPARVTSTGGLRHFNMGAA